MMDSKNNGGGAASAKSRSNSLAGRLVRDFFLGCIALVPLAIMIFVFYYIMLFVEAIGGMIFGLTKSLRLTIEIFILIVVALIYTGRKLRRREKWILNIIEQGISKIPLAGGWYTTIRDMVQAFTSGNGERGYLGTAKVPCGAGYVIGFVTKKEVLGDGSVLVTIFVPTSPNPTTGLVFFFPEESVEYMDMTPERAFTTIISLGMKS